jgi:hypothetical protein
MDALTRQRTHARRFQRSSSRIAGRDRYRFKASRAVSRLQSLTARRNALAKSQPFGVGSISAKAEVVGLRAPWQVLMMPARLATPPPATGACVAVKALTRTEARTLASV